MTQLKTGRRARPVKREGNTNYVSVIYNVVIKGFNPKIRVFRIFFYFGNKPTISKSIFGQESLRCSLCKLYPMQDQEREKQSMAKLKELARTNYLIK